MLNFPTLINFFALIFWQIQFFALETTLDAGSQLLFFGDCPQIQLLFFGDCPQIITYELLSNLVSDFPALINFFALIFWQIQFFVLETTLGAGSQLLFFGDCP